jgi:B9 domain-containing protein 2
MSNVDLESAKGASSNDDTRGKLSTMLKARIQDLKPFREELQCRKHSSKEKLAEKIPEVIFTGELVHGEGFQGTQLGVACSWHFVWDDPWTLLEVTYHNNCNSWIVRQGNFRGQTQLAASTDCNAPWNHPLDIHFAARSPLGWPKLVMQVQELDEHGCSHVAGYGFCHLPVTPGSSELTVCCWRPTGSVRDEISAYFLGNTSRLTSYDIISAKAAWANRCRLVTIPTGKVIVNLNVILRNFEGNIDMLQHSRAPPV